MSRVAYRPRESPYPIIKVPEAVETVLSEAQTLNTEQVNFQGQFYLFEIDGWFCMVLCNKDVQYCVVNLSQENELPSK